jgi:hypothetical protein
MRRPTAGAFALLLAGVSAWGCGDPEPDPYDYLRIVVDTDLAVPDDLDAFTVSVEREGVSLFSESFDEDVLDSLPDSVVLINEHPSNDSPEKLALELPNLTITVTGFLAETPRVWRSAVLQFNAGRLQLPLPLCAACIDQPCDPGQTCKRGACSDARIGATSALPGDDEDVDALSECGP